MRDSSSLNEINNAKKDPERNGEEEEEEEEEEEVTCKNQTHPPIVILAMNR